VTVEVYQMKVGRYKYITLYRELERCHVKNIVIGSGRVELMVKNLIII